MSENPRIGYYPAPEKTFTKDDLKEIFGLTGKHDDISLALRQILQTRLAIATTDSANPALSERAAGHAGGRIQEITDLMSELLSYQGLVQDDGGEVQARSAKGRR